MGSIPTNPYRRYGIASCGCCGSVTLYQVCLPAPHNPVHVAAAVLVCLKVFRCRWDVGSGEAHVPQQTATATDK